MPKPAPKPAMRRSGGMTKAANAGIHPFAPASQQAAAAQPITEIRESQESVNADRRQFQCRLPTDLLTEVALHAVHSGKTKRDITEEALREYLARHN